MLPKLVVILGPTAVGKTKVAVSLANQFNGEIISADSRQVYKGMDIGTGKDLNEYKINNSQIPYHLIDIVSPSEEYNLFTFQNNFYSAFDKIIKKNKQPFLVGGTGLYIHSILNNYNLPIVDFNSDRANELFQYDENKLVIILKKLNPQLHNTTDLISKDRIVKAILIAESENNEIPQKKNFSSIVFGITETRDIIKERITKRLKYRLQNGMIEEVEKLVNDGISFEKLDFFGLEYKFIGQYLQGRLTYNDMYQKLNSAIHKFAKRQMTWFRKMEREGIEINWIKFEEIETAKRKISEFLIG